MSPTLDLLATWGPPVLGLVGGGSVAGLLKVFFDRRESASRASREIAEGDSVQSSTWERWAAAADARAQKADEVADARVKAAEAAASVARTEAEASRRAAWAAEDTAARCRRETDDIRDQLSDLLEQVRGCPRAGCPLRNTPTILARAAPAVLDPAHAEEGHEKL